MLSGPFRSMGPIYIILRPDFDGISYEGFNGSTIRFVCHFGGSISLVSKFLSFSLSLEKFLLFDQFFIILRFLFEWLGLAPGISETFIVFLPVICLTFLYTSALAPGMSLIASLSAAQYLLEPSRYTTWLNLFSLCICFGEGE